MPQLNKGGKFVFGLSVVRDDLTIHIHHRHWEQKVPYWKKHIIFMEKSRGIRRRLKQNG